MPRRKRLRSDRREIPAPVGKRREWTHGFSLAFLALVVAIFYWQPLTSPRASIQWDAVDVHYSSQKYFGDQIRQGQLPFWTPFIYSGFPFLSDPQVGSWYPLNWPFFLWGISPRAIQLEITLHAMIAVVGAYWLGYALMGNYAASVIAAMAYAFSGFFAAHSSHVGMIQTASWLPWLILLAQQAVRERGVGWKVASGLLFGIAALAGHFQTILYCAGALVSICIWEGVVTRKGMTGATLTLVLTAAIGVVVSSVMSVPGLDLFRESVRYGERFTDSREGLLHGASLATLVWPNALGALSGNYKGPADITQHYLYAGLLLPPFALFALVQRTFSARGLMLFLVPAWYAAGPDLGLYRLLAILPGLGDVRQPIHAWFVAALGLALLGASGFVSLLRRTGAAWIVWAVPPLLFCDLFNFNSLANPLAFARQGFDKLYGDRTALFGKAIGPSLRSNERFYAPTTNSSFGSQNHPLDARIESTYGYNPLRLRRYEEYLAAAVENPRLIDALAATVRLIPEISTARRADSALPLATFPASVQIAERGAALQSLDPRVSAITDDEAPVDASAQVVGVERDGNEYRIRYRASHDALLRVAVPFFPGWTAATEDKELRVIPVDWALLGTVVPAGERTVRLRFRPRFFGLAALLSGFGCVASLAVLAALWTQGTLRHSDDFTERTWPSSGLVRPESTSR